MESSELKSELLQFVQTFWWLWSFSALLVIWGPMQYGNIGRMGESGIRCPHLPRWIDPPRNRQKIFMGHLDVLFREDSTQNSLELIPSAALWCHSLKEHLFPSSWGRAPHTWWSGGCINHACAARGVRLEPVFWTTKGELPKTVHNNHVRSKLHGIPQTRSQQRLMLRDHTHVPSRKKNVASWSQAHTAVISVDMSWLTEDQKQQMRNRLACEVAADNRKTMPMASSGECTPKNWKAKFRVSMFNLGMCVPERTGAVEQCAPKPWGLQSSQRPMQLPNPRTSIRAINAADLSMLNEAGRQIVVDIRVNACPQGEALAQPSVNTVNGQTTACPLRSIPLLFLTAWDLLCLKWDGGYQHALLHSCYFLPHPLSSACAWPASCDFLRLNHSKQAFFDPLSATLLRLRFSFAACPACAGSRVCLDPLLAPTDLPDEAASSQLSTEAIAPAPGSPQRRLTLVSRQPVGGGSNDVYTYIYICCEVIMWAKFGLFRCYYLGQVGVTIWAK